MNYANGGGITVKFEYIPKNKENCTLYATSKEKLYRFINDFSIVGIGRDTPMNLSASYFWRLLQKGSSAKARYAIKDDEHSYELHPYDSYLLDHGVFWKRKDKSVICTAIPYGYKERMLEYFDKMVKEFNYPDTIKMEFLDDAYRYRNGAAMLVISNGGILLPN